MRETPHHDTAVNLLNQFYPWAEKTFRELRVVDAKDVENFLDNVSNLQLDISNRSIFQDQEYTEEKGEQIHDKNDERATSHLFFKVQSFTNTQTFKALPDSIQNAIVSTLHDIGTEIAEAGILISARNRSFLKSGSNSERRR